MGWRAARAEDRDAIVALMRTWVAAALTCLVAAAGCGGGDDGGGSAKPGGDAGAQAFIECFDVPGYKAATPPAGQESFFALEAEQKGFPNTPVNVTPPNAIGADVFLVFFESKAKAEQALDEVGRTNAGDVPPQQRGPAVIGYTDEAAKAKTEAAIGDCL